MAVGILCIIGIGAGYWKFQDWTFRFSDELDHFFGVGNWECIEEETNKSRMVSDYNTDKTRRVPKRYRNWYITYTDRYGEEKECVITNHTMIINHKKRFPLSSKWYTAKQALTLELMEVSFDEAGEEVQKQSFILHCRKKAGLWQIQ